MNNGKLRSAFFLFLGLGNVAAAQPIKKHTQLVLDCCKSFGGALVALLGCGVLQRLEVFGLSGGGVWPDPVQLDREAARVLADRGGHDDRQRECRYHHPGGSQGVSGVWRSKPMGSHFGVGEFTTFILEPILVVGLANAFGPWPYGSRTMGGLWFSFEQASERAATRKS